ncbi:MAG: serine/threonine-protein kinase [Planctomycetota bacterium]
MRQAACPAVSGYTILGEIARGGMSTVYRARERVTGRSVVVKVLAEARAREPTLCDRFLCGARAALRLDHPHIVRCLGAGRDGTFCWMVLELVEGESVAERLFRRGVFPPDEALAIILQVTRGLCHLWEAGVVHRDVKPENILLSMDGTAKLSDFGLAILLEEAAAQAVTGRTVGTPRYIAPELAWGGAPDSRTDLYSLGAAWYHLVSGAPPFAGASERELMMRHAYESLPPILERAPQVGAAAARVMARMLEKAPEDRYATPVELLNELEALRLPCA